MCGIAGFLSQNLALNKDNIKFTINEMCRQISTRGPDAFGDWSDPEFGIAFGHRRLSIVDLTEAGAQPMHSNSGRWILTFNGEIYNHQKLRSELEKSSMAPVWRGHSDTETLLAGFDAWGIRATIEKCVGMFAMAVWCRRTERLSLIRDRLGEKPLYYGFQGQGNQTVFLFGSELKALRIHPAFEAEIDHQALASYLHFDAK
jgi:asparagine synthase (glutamine-hydrolysing)